MKATCLLKSTIKLTTEWHRMTSPVVGGPPMERVCTGWRDDVTVAADDDNGVMIIQISMQTHTWGGYQNMSGGQIGTCSATDHRPPTKGRRERPLHVLPVSKGVLCFYDNEGNEGCCWSWWFLGFADNGPNQFTQPQVRCGQIWKRESILKNSFNNVFPT